MRTKLSMLAAVALALAILGVVTPTLSADPLGPVPTGWACNGSCGTDGSDGVVPVTGALPNSTYEWVSTYDPTINTTTGNFANYGVGALPNNALGGETNGSTLATSTFTVTDNSTLNFYFDYVTSDGADSMTNYADYAWAALFDQNGNLVSLLFTARTEPTGTVVPGPGMPNPTATLDPTSVTMSSGTTWSPLGPDSGSCYGPGCGNTGWVDTTYNIATGGTYYLEVGVVNWNDQLYNSGLAMDGVAINGVDIDPSGMPEPGTWLMLAIGVASVLVLRRKRLA